jgi:hypothetical protein
MDQASQRRGTIFPRSTDTGETVNEQVPEPLSLPHISALPNTLKRKDHSRPVPPPRLPLSVNTESSQQSSKRRSEGHLSRIGQSGNPWRKYRRFGKDNQAGSATIAYEMTPTHPVVAVKETGGRDQAEAQDLIRTAHPNVVSLLDAFLSQEATYLIYECMDVDLVQVQGCPCGVLEDFEIAAVCKEVRTHDSASCPASNS